MNRPQYKAILKAMKKGLSDFSYVSSIEGDGPVKEFEETFARATGAKYGLAFSSCTAALHTALMTFGIGPGDEVIVSPYTWGQSVSPVLFTGATAAFADIDSSTLTLDPESVEEKISSKTKAIIPVHIFGIPADMDAICSIAKKHDLAVIADAAQAFGSLSKGRNIGSLGDVSCFSIGRGKAVYGGEGGVLVTNAEIIYEKAIAISQHPLRSHREILSYTDFSFQDGLRWNYRIHPFAAVLALADLEIAYERVESRKMIMRAVHAEIEHIPGVEPVYCAQSDIQSAYGIPLTYQGLDGSHRESFVESFRSERIHIQPGPINIPVHLRPTFKKGGFPFKVIPHASHRKNSCPVAEGRCKNHELIAYYRISLE